MSNNLLPNSVIRFTIIVIYMRRTYYLILCVLHARRWGWQRCLREHPPSANLVNILPQRPVGDRRCEHGRGGHRHRRRRHDAGVGAWLSASASWWRKFSANWRGTAFGV
eukprot:COSAG03_NODE_5474_length_1242_cov_798.217848_1_plen_109_part_00